MSDNRFAMMRVNRSGQTSRRTSGYETIQAGFQGNGNAAAARNAHAGARGGASRSGTVVRSQSPDGVALGTDGGRPGAGLATSTIGSPRSDERRRASQAQQDVGRGSIGQRLSDGAVDLGAHRQAHQARIWPFVQLGARLAGHSRSRLLQPTADRAGDPTRRSGDPDLEDQALAGAKKNARRQGRTIVFIDESGLSERPTRVKTWARKGCTPTLQYSFNWKQLSLIAGASFWRIYFRFFHGTIKGPQLVEFLKALKAQIRGKLLIIWDGLPAHRSAVVRDYVESLEGQIALERLPGYAPELNPVEYLFGYAKQRELANLCLDTIDEVRRYAMRRIRSMQRRPTLIRAFWTQAELPI